MHPRVFHEVMKKPYQRDSSPAKVDSESLEKMTEILDEKSEQDHSWWNEKLFNLGYSKRIYGPEDLREIHENPSMDFGPDLLPEYNSILLDNPYREGHKKRKGDAHYTKASNIIALEMSQKGLEIE